MCFRGGGGIDMSLMGMIYDLLGIGIFQRSYIFWGMVHSREWYLRKKKACSSEWV